MLGGSVTAAYGVDDDRSFSRRLEELLNSGSKGCHHVINAGQILYSARDIVDLLKFLEPIYKPDLVFFELNAFAMNSPFTVDASGRLHEAKIDRALFDFTQSFWGLNGGTLALDGAVSGESNWWERTEWDKRHWWEHSYVFMAFKPKISALARGHASCGERCLELRPTFTTKSGAVERLPVYSPLYLSPSFREDFYAFLNGLIAETKIPIVFVLNDFFADPARLTPSPRWSLVSFSRFAGMPAKDLFGKYNLGWDAHLNERGNEIVAAGIADYLAERGYEPGSSALALDARTEEYVAAARLREEQNRAAIGPSVDIAGKLHAHQIVSGITPDGVVSAHRASVLLRKTGETRLHLRGESLGETPKRIELRVRAGASDKVEKLELAPGRFDIAVHAEKIPDGLVDVWLTCRGDGCDSTRYDFVGLDR